MCIRDSIPAGSIESYSRYSIVDEKQGVWKTVVFGVFEQDFLLVGYGIAFPVQCVLLALSLIHISSVMEITFSIKYAVDKGPTPPITPNVFRFILPVPFSQNIYGTFDSG